MRHTSQEFTVVISTISYNYFPVIIYLFSTVGSFGFELDFVQTAGGWQHCYYLPLERVGRYCVEIGDELHNYWSPSLAVLPNKFLIINYSTLVCVDNLKSFSFNYYVGTFSSEKKLL